MYRCPECGCTDIRLEQIFYGSIDLDENGDCTDSCVGDGETPNNAIAHCYGCGHEAHHRHFDTRPPA